MKSIQQKSGHTEWDCKYHIVWIPKYRKKKLYKELRQYLGEMFRDLASQKECTIEEGHLMSDHVHLLVMIPPKLSISSYVGQMKGRVAIRVLNKYKKLRQKPYWGNQFWAKGYCVDTVGLDGEMIRKYVKYQEANERRVEQQRLF
jgi:putative transposase